MVTPPAPPWTPTPVPTVGELLRDNLSRRVQGWNQAWSSLAHPSRTLAGVRHGWPTWREFFAEQRAPLTSLNRPIGAQRRLVTVGTRLDLAKQIAHGHHAKVNEVVLTVVAGGLRELLGNRGEDLDELTLASWCPSHCPARTRARHWATRTGGWWCRCPLASPMPLLGCA